MQWDTAPIWKQQIERRLYELGALVKGNLPIQADRIADLVEQIDELRKLLLQYSEELKAVHERQDKMADWLKENYKKENGK